MRTRVGLALTLMGGVLTACGGTPVQPPAGKCWVYAPEDRPRPQWHRGIGMWLTTEEGHKLSGGGIVAVGRATMTPALRDHPDLVDGMARTDGAAKLAETIRAGVDSLRVTHRKTEGLTTGESDATGSRTLAFGEPIAGSQQRRSSDATQIEHAYETLVEIDTAVIMRGFHQVDSWESGACTVFNLYAISKEDLKRAFIKAGIDDDTAPDVATRVVTQITTTLARSK